MGSERLATIPDLFGKTGAIFSPQAFLDTLTICRESIFYYLQPESPAADQEASLSQFVAHSAAGK